MREKSRESHTAFSTTTGCAIRNVGCSTGRNPTGTVRHTYMADTERD